MDNICDEEDLVSLNEEIDFDKFMTDIVGREEKARLLNEEKRNNGKSLRQAYSERYMELPQNRMVVKK